MKKWLLMIVALLAAAVTLIFIAFRTLVPAPKMADIIIVGKTSDASIEFWNVMRDGFDAAAKEFNVKYTYTAPDTENDVGRQIEILHEAIEKKPDAIVLVSSDYTRLGEEAQRAINNKIPLVTLDSDVDVAGVPLVATDNFQAGVKAGRELYKIIKSDRDIAVVSYMKNAASAISREEGFRQGFGYGQKDRIKQVLYCDYSKQKAFELVLDLLKSNPNIGGLVGLNEFSTTGAADAIKFLNMQDRVKLVGFDSSQYEINLLEEGVVSAIVIQQPFNMGYLSLKAAVDVIGKKNVAGDIYTDSVLVTGENMFDPEIEKILFPVSR